MDEHEQKRARKGGGAAGKMGAQSWRRTIKDERAKTEAFAFSYSKELCAQNFARPSLRVLLQLCAPIFAAAPPPLRALLCSCSSNFAHSSLRVLVQLCVSYFARARGRAKISKQAAAAAAKLFLRAKAGIHANVQRTACKGGRAKQGAQSNTRKTEPAKQHAQSKARRRGQRRRRKVGSAKESAQRRARKRTSAKEGAQRRGRK